MFSYRARCSCGTKVRIEVSSTYYITSWKERIDKWESAHRKHGTMVSVQPLVAVVDTETPGRENSP